MLWLWTVSVRGFETEKAGQSGTAAGGKGRYPTSSGWFREQRRGGSSSSDTHGWYLGPTQLYRRDTETEEHSGSAGGEGFFQAVNVEVGVVAGMFGSSSLC